MSLLATRGPGADIQLRKTCQHPYLSDPSLERLDLSEEEQHKLLTDASGKLLFLKQLLPELKKRGHRVLLFSQVRHNPGSLRVPI